MTRRTAKLCLILLEVIMIFIALVFIYPVLLMFVNSVKPFGEVVTDVIALPTKIEWQNYTDVMNKMDYKQLFLNNCIITIIGTTGIILLSSLCAYILDRRKTKYTKIIRTVIITPLLIPFQTFMITLLKVMNVVGLSGSTWGLGVQYWGFGIPLAVFIYVNFMRTIPKEIDESVMIDGGTILQTYAYVIFPLLKPVSVTVIVLNVMWIWNDFLLPLLMVNSAPKTKTLVLAAYTFVGQFNTQWHYAMTAMVLAIMPSIVLFVFLQKYIVEGVIAGAVKG